LVLANQEPGNVTGHDTKIRRMTLVSRILKALLAALAVGVYVWFAAVRNVGRVKRRKAARRASRRR
jgi:hypothetical protein